MPDPKTATEPSSGDPRGSVLAWLQEHGDDLFRYAMAHVNCVDVAEELVQETFLVAISQHKQFRGDSTVRTWLTGILRRKVVDYYRNRYRQRQSDVDIDALSSFFSKHGHIKNVTSWPRDPSEELEKREFWETFDACMKKLRTPWAEVFALRVIDEMATADICAALEISESNLSVRLHRARLALRECLEKNWFRRK